MLTNFIVPLRVTPEQEEKGLDITQHGEEATDWRVRLKKPLL
jgi:ammonia channel protein AmtB